MQKLSSLRSIPPAVALITLSQARSQVRWDGNADTEVDDNLNLLIEVAMSHLDGAEGILGRALISQTWIDSSSGFPVGAALPVALAPLISVSAITYYDSDNVLQTLDAASYGVFDRYDGGYVKLHSGQSWPSTYTRDDAVSVVYVAGYGSAPADVPATIRLAALELIAHWFENREAVLVGTISSEIPLGIARLLSSHIRPKF